MRPENKKCMRIQWSNKERCNHFNYLENERLKKGIRGKGVGQDNHIYYRKSYIQNGLTYSRPCLCGSCEHRNINHVDCLLNPMYEDV